MEIWKKENKEKQNAWCTSTIYIEELQQVGWKSSLGTDGWRQDDTQWSLFVDHALGAGDTDIKNNCFITWQEHQLITITSD